MKSPAFKKFSFALLGVLVYGQGLTGLAKADEPAADHLPAATVTPAVVADPSPALRSLSISTPTTQPAAEPPTAPELELAPAAADTVPATESEILPEPSSADTAAEALPLSSEAPATAENGAAADTLVQILSPVADAVLDVPSATITVQYPIAVPIELRANGQVVSQELVGRTATDSATGQEQRTWYGVVLVTGENQITVTQTGTGDVLAQVQVTVRGKAEQLQVSTVESRISADGRATATVQGQLLDSHGNPSSQDSVITLIPSSGQFIGEDVHPDQPGFQVETQAGQFSAILQAGVTAGTVSIRASSGDLEAYTQMQFATELRPTVLAGVIDFRLGGSGTNYFGSLRDFLPPNGSNDFSLSATGAAFAITSFGEWRFTGALRTDRSLNQGCDGSNPLLRQYQACDRAYPVYGDDSTSEILAPSTDSLYLRFERTSPVPSAGLDYAAWGDYRTDTEFARPSQLFSSVSRVLHGFSGNYNFGNLQVSGIYGNNLDGFQRDTLAPDGTSGFYFLSRRLLTPGSESVYLELEELGRPGQVIERQRLSRGPDYEIDYDRGSLLFRRPILRTAIDDQGRTLVRRIVATYEYEGGLDTSLYGGRLQYHLDRSLNRESWLGATYLQENQGAQQFQLYGADAQISFAQDGLLIAEYARSTNGLESTSAVSGEALRFEISSSLSENLTGRAYWQQVSPGFSNNATTSFVPGQRRYGVELEADLSSTTSLHFGYDHEDNYGNAPAQLSALETLFNPGAAARPGQPLDNSLSTFTAGIRQQIGAATTSVDWVHRDRSDRINPQLSRTTDQIRSLLNLPIADNVTFTALNELNLSSQSDPLYPNRTLLGLSWTVYPGISLGVTHQILNGGEFDNDTLTSLYLSGEYHLGPETQVTGNFSFFDSGQIAGSVGIQHGIVIAPGLRMDLAYEHIFQDGNLITGAGTQFAQPFAVGQSASALGLTSGDSYSVGLSYNAGTDFQASARWEHRTSPTGSNTVISANALGQITPALTALVRFQQASAANQLLEGLGDTTSLRIGLAYRNPDNDAFNALLRYEYRSNPGIVPETLFLGSGSGSTEHVFSAEAIYAPNWQWEFYGKYAFRVSASYLASDLVGSSTVSLGQLRVTYRPDNNWDFVAEGRWINQPSAGYSEMGFALEAGYYLSPNIRLSAGYSFGSAYDRDFYGARSAGGPYLGLTLKLDQNLISDFGIDSPANPEATAPADATQSASSPTVSGQPQPAISPPAPEFSSQP